MRQAEIIRKTGETDIRVFLDLDGKGTCEISTGVGFLDHMLELFARHGRFAMCYVNTTGGVTYAHWIGLEKFKGRVHVMDPCDFDSSPLSRHEAIRGRRVSIACMIGFVRE